MESFDLTVIGGGIVGLATAFTALRQRPGRSVLVLEKEDAVALHQTGRNSGVIHSGIYYKPGSEKALNCRRGKDLLLSFAKEHAVPHEVCGKLIVAVAEPEIAGLERLFERGRSNGVQCRMIDAAQAKELEPAVACVKALLVSETGIIDYVDFCRKLLLLIEGQGGRVHFGARVTAIQREAGMIRLLTSKGEFLSRMVANCAGLHSDRIAAMSTRKRDVRIVPFRGEYFALKQESVHLCKNLIYPVPDPEFPFLGVHFTRMVQGGVECGPNAVLAFAREGYTKSKINLRDLADVLTYGGFWKLARKHWRTGSMEMWRSFSKAAFVRSLQRLIPGIRSEDLVPAPAGVRAQALARDGRLVDDFVIRSSDRIVDVLNAPSPAATSSLAIGETVAEHLARQERTL